MARNVELKARVPDLGAVEARLRPIATDGPVPLTQHDVFYAVPQGRLKLRHFGDGTAELIRYDRPDTPHPALSSYDRVPVAEPAATDALLRTALGLRAEVSKRRTVYWVGRTRVHLDQVEGLGSFIELEVVLGDAEAEAAGHDEAERLLAALEISTEALLAQAYVDLLTGRG